QAVYSCAIVLHNINIKVAIPVGGKGNFFTIMAPYRVTIVSVVDGQRNGRSPFRRHFEQIAFVFKCNPFPVGRNGGLLHPPRICLSRCKRKEKKTENS